MQIKREKEDGILTLPHHLCSLHRSQNPSKWDVAVFKRGAEGEMEGR